MKTKLFLIAAIALVALALVVNLVHAQQASQPVTKEQEAVKTSVPEPAVSTPSAIADKFQPLLGQWKYSDNLRFISELEIKSIVDGEARGINFKLRGGHQTDSAMIYEADGKMHVKIILPGGATWKLVYDDYWGGVLTGLGGHPKPASRGHLKTGQ